MCGSSKLRQARSGLAPSCGTSTAMAPTSAHAPGWVRHVRPTCGSRETRKVPASAPTCPCPRDRSPRPPPRTRAGGMLWLSTREEEKNFQRERAGVWWDPLSTRGGGDSCWRHSTGLATIYSLSLSLSLPLSLSLSSSSLFPTWQLVDGISTPTVGALMVLTTFYGSNKWLFDCSIADHWF
jgi:hypothetical protein